MLSQFPSNALFHCRWMEHITRTSLAQAQKFDFHPKILAHLQELKNRLG
jgi:hypothetical protein